MRVPVGEVAAHLVGSAGEGYGVVRGDTCPVEVVEVVFRIVAQMYGVDLCADDIARRRVKNGEFLGTHRYVYQQVFLW